MARDGDIIRFWNIGFIQKIVWYVMHMCSYCFHPKLLQEEFFAAHFKISRLASLPWALVGGNALKLWILKGSWVFTSMCCGIRIHLILHLISFLYRLITQNKQIFTAILVLVPKETMAMSFLKLLILAQTTLMVMEMKWKTLHFTF